jgi:hypothetical protein
MSDHDGLIERLRWDRPEDAEFWQDTPPSWAQDPFNDNEPGHCGNCGSWLDVVRPGKWQCPACGSDGDKAARWKAADALVSLHAEVGRLRYVLEQVATTKVTLADVETGAVFDVLNALAQEARTALNPEPSP